MQEFIYGHLFIDDKRMVRDFPYDGYSTLDLSFKLEIEDNRYMFVDVLRDLGEDGWMMTGVHPQGAGGYIYWFMKEVGT